MEAPFVGWMTCISICGVCTCRVFCCCEFCMPLWNLAYIGVDMALTHIPTYRMNLCRTVITVVLTCTGSFLWFGFSTMPNTANADSTIQNNNFGEKLFAKENYIHYTAYAPFVYISFLPLLGNFKMPYLRAF